VTKGNLKTGIVTESVGGICSVFASDELYSCRIRGRIKNEGWRILPGDKVAFSLIGQDQGIIEQIHPRHSLIKRPYIANVTQVILVCSVAVPSPNLILLDRLLVSTAYHGLKAIIVWNKCDLVSEETVEGISKPYALAGYKNIYTVALQGKGLPRLKESLRGHISVLAGPSGVGKSSILNGLIPGLKLETQDVSKKISRGRHTTRTVKLINLASDSWIADSPGFSVLDISEILPEQLAKFYPEMAKAEGCYFAGCLHQDEPDCAVKESVTEGTIDIQRYQRYIQFLKELQLMQERKY
jgi:ribosome biogenesis GTPase